MEYQESYRLDWSHCVIWMDLRERGQLYLTQSKSARALETMR